LKREGTNPQNDPEILKREGTNPPKWPRNIEKRAQVTKSLITNPKFK